jgi:hypothetical protein
MELQDPIERAIEDNMHNQWTYYTGDAETLAWILQASNSSFQERSVEECVLFALNISYTAHLQDMAHIVRTVLKGREIDEHAVSVTGTSIHFYIMLLSASETFVPFIEGGGTKIMGGLKRSSA